MNEPSTTIQEPIVQPSAPPPAPAEPAQPPPSMAPQQPASPLPASKPKTNTMYLVIAGVLCVGILVTAMLYLRSSAKPTELPVVVATPTITPTPTPPPNISRIASTSAFAAYSEEIASFSAVLDSFTLQDSTLAPPTLDTDLDISN